MDNTSELFDPATNRLISVRADAPFVVVPKELYPESPYIKAVYIGYARLACGKNGATVELPPVPELAELCGVSIYTLHRAEKRLISLGWITIHRMKFQGRDTGRRGTISLLEPIISIARTATEFAQRVVQSAVPQLDIICSSDPSAPVGESSESTNTNLSQILRTCRKADRRGQTLAHFNEQTIRAVCHDAPQRDIAIAILEVERYNGKPSDILKLFAARFKDGKLKEGRKGSFRVSKSEFVSTHDVHNVATAGESIPVAISHDETHTPATVDALCTSLNAREVVERGKLPIAALNTNSQILVVDEDLGNPYVKLAGNVSLVRVAPGKWGIKWQKSTRGESTVNRRARTASVGETLASVAPLSSTSK